MTVNRSLILSFVILLTLVLLSCGGGGGDKNNALKVVSISLTPSDSEMLAGGTRQLKAMGMYSDNITRDISTYSDLVWNSSNTAVATIAGGKIKANGAGTTAVSVTLDGVTASTNITVKAVTNKAILYISTSADTSQYFSEYDITVESDAQTIFRYVPDDDLADVVEQNTSYSFASSRIYPYTVDNRLFIRREVRPFEYSGSHGFDEYDPKSHQQLLSFNVSDPNYGMHSDSAILGITYYYRVSRTWDYLYGDLGGEFKKVEITNATGNGTKLLDFTDPDNSTDHILQASSGNLYAAKYYDPSPGVTYLEIYKRDPITGKINYATLKRWTVTDAAQYHRTVKFAFDGNTAYWVRQKVSNGQIEIWKNDFISSGDASQIFSGVVQGINSISFFDASNGHLAIGDSAGYVLLYETSTGTSSIINVGFSYYFLQLLYIV